MERKRPYRHILKNLVDQHASEIVPVLLPRFQIKQPFDFELPELRSTEISTTSGEKESNQGLVDAVLPGAKVEAVYQTEFIENSGNFERAYRVSSTTTTYPAYLLLDFQTERDDEDLPSRLLVSYTMLCFYASKDGIEERTVDEDGETRVRMCYEATPYVFCPFPSAEPQKIEDISITFNFKKILLWEQDAREMLNTHVSGIYFMLPAMKNADADLLKVAIDELVQQYQVDETELGRHLTGLHFMLEMSETLPDEEKQRTREYLKPYQHLIKDTPLDE